MSSRYALGIAPSGVILSTAWGNICESFCDTAGWAFGGGARYVEMTLAKRFRNLRMKWFAEQMLQQPLSI